MITLITGAPGTGKSAALVKLLVELAKGRPIYVDGIPELKVDHLQLSDPSAWPELVPDGSVVVIDEVQRVWRPAGPGAKIPPDIAALETHRHRGLDFYIVTQHPKLVHQNVRNLVGRHVHLRDLGVLGRWWYEWPEAADPGTWRNAPVKKRYRLPKKTLALYRSATEHIKPVRSVPPMLIVLVLAVLAFGVAAWWLARSLSARMEPNKPPPGQLTKAAPSSSAAPARVPHQAITSASLIEAFTPRMADQPETAPAYDHLRTVRSMPRVIGGFIRNGQARCFRPDGFDAGIGEAACRRWIESPPWDPYRDRTATAAAGAAVPAGLVPSPAMAVSGPGS